MKNVVTKRAEAAIDGHSRHNRNSIRSIVPKLSNDSELATKHPETFAAILIQKMTKLIEAKEDDSILSEHLERVMKTPKNKARQSKKRFNFNDVDLKVGDWLASSVAPKVEAKQIEKEQKRESSQKNAENGRLRGVGEIKIPVYSYGSNGLIETNSTYEYTQYRDEHKMKNQLSSDSGLSSIRIDTESEIAESEMIELNGLKQRLIEETEGKICTKLLYHFKNEKFNCFQTEISVKSILHQ